MSKKKKKVTDNSQLDTKVKDSKEKKDEVIDDSQLDTKEYEEEEIVDNKSEEELLIEKLKVSEDKYLRAYAEFENIKKRLEREKMIAIEYSSEKFAKDLLPVLDALNMAIDSTNSEADPTQLLENLKEGVELTLKQMTKALDLHGINEVEYGELDPNIHQAVMRVDSKEVESGHIAQVMQKGYKYKQRTLRAAMVSVAN